MKYVIIGNSAAAIGGVEGIRSRDKTGGITLVSDESHFTYSPVSYTHLDVYKRQAYNPAVRVC